MHSARLGIRLLTEQLPDVLPKIRDALSLMPKKATLRCSGSFNADKDGNVGADAKVDVDVTAVVKGAPAEISAGLKSAYDNQGEAKWELEIEFG